MNLVVWLIAAPAIFAMPCLLLRRSTPLQRLALVAGCAAHFSLIVLSWQHPQTVIASQLLGLDPLGHLLLTCVSVLFLATSIYFVGYHQKALLSQQVFLACLLLLLATLSVVCAARHFGVLWVGLETASLAATLLIYPRLGERALEATWKFLLMNSVGVALALLGIFCIGVATSGVSGGVELNFASLILNARKLDPVWLRAGFLISMVGFGTKLGLAPMHSWKPDAYGEAPPPVASILAGGMTLGALLGLLRVVQVCQAAGLGAFAGAWMCAFGLLSTATAAIFVVRNYDYRRALAYTSVEHMGVLVIGAGLGAGGAYAAMLHAMHNTLNKGVLFFVAGLLWRIYRTNHATDIRGTLRRHPAVAVLLLGGLCATCGLPPFGMFYSEVGILVAAARLGHWWVAAIFAITLAIVFVGLMTTLLPMIFGPPAEHEDPAENPGWHWRLPVMLAPTAALLALALGLGIYQPLAVRSALQQAANVIAPPQALVAAADKPAARTEPRPPVEPQTRVVAMDRQSIEVAR